MSHPSLDISSPLFKAVADRSFDSIMVTRATDEHGASEIVFVNKVFSDLTGYDREEVIGETPGFLQVIGLFTRALFLPIHDEFTADVSKLGVSCRGPICLCSLLQGSGEGHSRHDFNIEEFRQG